MLARRNVHAQCFFILSLSPVGADIDPTGLRVLENDGIHRSDIAPAVFAVPLGSRKLKNVYRTAGIDVFENRAVGNPFRCRRFELLEFSLERSDQRHATERRIEIQGQRAPPLRAEPVG